MLHITEKILFHQIKNGDEQAFTVFYNQYKDKIYRFIYFKISDEEKTRDLVNETFIKVFNYLRSNQEIDDFQAFLYKTARNLVIDFYRCRQGDISLEDIPDIISDEDLSEQVQNRMEIVNIKKYLSSLKPEYQEAVRLHFFEGLSFSEIAKIIDESPGNIRVRAHRGMRQLKSKIKNQNDKLKC